MPPTTKITEPETTDDPPGTDPFGRPAEAPTQPMTPTHAVPAVGTPSVVAAGGENCAACGASMAADQRYCLACGERRGQARFSAMPGTPSTATAAAREPAPERHRFSAGTTLIAGVATLLLAMGVGVLIGSESSSSPTPTNPKVQVVNVGGGGAAASAATTPATTSPSGGSSGSKSSGKSHKNHSSANAATTASTSSAASATTVKTPPPTVTVGAKGSGPGYQHGHFTGNFFGP